MEFKTQWSVIHRTSAIPFKKTSTRVAKKDVSTVYEGQKYKKLEARNVPGWSCGPILGDLRPGEWSGVLRLLSFLGYDILGSNDGWHGQIPGKKSGKEHVQQNRGVVQLWDFKSQLKFSVVNGGKYHIKKIRLVVEVEKKFPR
eukprot:1152230-Pelagomonas_calceolata.AAC.1